MTDTIYLSGIKAYGYTGALPEENILGQWFEAEITLYIDLVQASHSDDLADTCDYRSVIGNALRIILSYRPRSLTLVAKFRRKLPALPNHPLGPEPYLDSETC